MDRWCARGEHFLAVEAFANPKDRSCRGCVAAGRMPPIAMTDPELADRERWRRAEERRFPGVDIDRAHKARR